MITSTITVGDIRASVAEVVKLCREDSRVLDYINEACERLLWKGPNKDTYGRFSIAVTGGVITWPRVFDNILSCALDSQPVSLRNGWYEFLTHGPGVISDTECSGNMALIERPSSPLQVDIPAGTAQVIRLYTSVAGDAAKLVLLQGTLSSGVEIRSEYPASSGTYINGRNVALATPSFAVTSEQFASVTGVQKALTQGPVTAKAWDGATETTIATWDPDDTRPSFRRSLVTAIPTTQSATATVVAKLKYIPVRTDNDWVIPSNRAAIWQMAKAIWFERNEQLDKALQYAALAKQSLDEQTLSSQGGAQQEINIKHGEIYGSSGVPQIQ